MQIEQLSLTNYRNYNDLTIDFNNEVNVIIGENAQGKTNLLEAIYLLAFTKSHRTTKEKELIQWDKSFAKVAGILNKRNQSMPLEIVISPKGKKAKWNRLEQRRLSDYIGALNVVMFAPEDLALVKGSPQHRRRFIDMELGQIQPTYIYHLGQYQKILRQRNHLLKLLQRRKHDDDMMLTILTEQLVEHAATILERRFNFLERLREWSHAIHLQISRQTEQLEITYVPTINVLETANKGKIETIYMEKFGDIQQQEIERGTTLIGPHRDDLAFIVNGRNVQTYGSQGQQRTTALSIKLAEIELIKNEINEYPVLLLDDVLSELDDHRQSHLLHAIQGKVQTFVTTTTVDGIDHDTLNQAAIYHVSQGQIKK